MNDLGPTTVNIAMRNLTILFALLAWLFQGSGLTAGELAVKIADKEPPQELSDAIRHTLQTQAVQLLDGDKAVFEFWFCHEVPLKSKPDSLAKALDAIKQATLLGAVSVQGDNRDYKDNGIAPGVYTMRLGLQPSDGDHLGTSEYAWFAVLILAKYDTKPDGITDYKPLVKASGKETPSGHPLILSLRPVSADPGDQPKLNDPVPDHKSVVVKVPAKVEGKDEKISLAFELVYHGIGKK